MTTGIAAALERLDNEPAPAALRFDSGAPFSGAAAVLPSAYNPPTLAHEHLLQRALDSYGLQHAVALLTTRNVDKGVHGASLADRIGMLLALGEDWPELCVAASNQARIIDQARALAEAFPDTEFDFIVGFDTLERLFARKYYTDMEAELEPFFERHRVLAANRGPVEAHHVEAWIAEHAGGFAGRILLLQIDDFPASLSSTRVRESLAAGSDELHLPPAVSRYLAEHRLYQ